PFACVWAPYQDESSGGHGRTSEVSITNPNAATHKYTVKVITKEKPQGVSTPVSLAPAETNSFLCNDLSVCGIGHGLLHIEWPEGAPFIGSLLVSDAVGLATIEWYTCFTLSQH